jgi:acylglycerol lipase
MKHVEGVFRGHKEAELYYQAWLPENKAKALLLILHGLAEHSGRYADSLVKYFVPRGYLCCAYDQHGHGRSPGVKGYVDSFSHFTADLERFIAFARQKYPAPRTFLLAHSVGGTVATAFIAQRRDHLSGAVLSGATLQPGKSVPRALAAVAPLLSRLIPRVGLYTIDSTALSRDPTVARAYLSDPLVYTGKISTRLGVELLKTMRELPEQFPRIELPILILQGSADRLSHPDGSRLLYERAGSRDKNLKIYEGFYHEIFNEPGCETVFRDIESWLIRLCERI